MLWTQLGDGGAAPDRGQAAQVPVVEHRARLMLDRAPDVVSRRLALLDRHLRHARQRPTGLVYERRYVADGVCLGVPWKRKVGLDEHVAALAERHAECPDEG